MFKKVSLSETLKLENVTGNNKSADANMETDYWTGHYTTRPLMKSLVARAGHAKHTAEIAASIFCAKEDSKMITNNNICGAIVENNDLLTARSVTSVVQHHDSITGTSKVSLYIHTHIYI